MPTIETRTEPMVLNMGPSTPFYARGSEAHGDP